jgi:UDPglucose 6-dehydrogenase
MVGTGYVGLVTGACLADFGNQVTCVDVDKGKISSLNEGQIPFYEPGLKELVERNKAKGRLIFTTKLDQTIQDSEIVFIAVGTPMGKGGAADLAAVSKVAETVAENLNGYKIVVNKSTVPVGTGARVHQIIEEKTGGEVEFDVVSNPEFLREGSAIGDFMHPDRVVIGTTSSRAMKIMSEIYRPLYLIETPIVQATVETAEMIKYASNAFLATKISFINEISRLCEEVGADVQVLAKAVGLDGRIGPKFLHAGAGYGGSCFPKDTVGLLKVAEAAGAELCIVSAAVEANERQRAWMVQKVIGAVGDLSGKTIGILGLSFKPRTDDVREAPALYVIRDLQTRGAEIKAYDPVAMSNAAQVLEQVTYCDDAYAVCDGSNALVLMTEWNEFRELDMARIKELLKEPVVIDTRNIYEPGEMSKMGFRYVCVGRGRPASKNDCQPGG